MPVIIDVKRKQLILINTIWAKLKNTNLVRKGKLTLNVKTNE